MIVWGITGNSHDASLSVFEVKPKNYKAGITYDFTCIDEPRLLFSSHSERFSGIKNDGDLNEGLIKYAMFYGRPSRIFWYEKPFIKSIRQLRAGQGICFAENNIQKYLAKYGINVPIVYVPHHHSHAAAGYFTSEFRDATIVCLDSIGEFETFTIWKANDQKLKKIFSQSYPHSVGLWYSAMTQRIGLKPQEDEYILMGMAAYGNPWKYYTNIINDFFLKLPSWDDPRVLFKKNLHQGCQHWRLDISKPQQLFDIAASTQMIYEHILNAILGHAKRLNKSTNLVLMGGCALNCSANHLAYKYFDNVWIMPSPGDAGSSIGAVLAKYQQHIEWTGPFLGYDIIKPYPVDSIIDELLTNGIVGVANGKAEFGPRALGNRSLLADPRGHDIKDRVNKIKRRQEFRPFAPAILAEESSNYFSGHANPYMQYTSQSRYPDLYPAISHVDNTSRVQTVSHNDNEGFRKLLEEWFKRTGCPMLLNTSLNIKGKPIVNDEKDAKDFEEFYGVKVF